MDRLGLSYEILHARNPKLVYATIRGFGDPRTGKSPYADWPAYDVVGPGDGRHHGDHRSRQGHADEGRSRRRRHRSPAISCAFGIVAAILRAHKTGRGQFVDVGMVDAMLAVCERIVHQHSFAGGVPVPEGNHHPLLCPFGMFPAKDGFVTIAAHADTQFPILCRLIDRPEMAHRSAPGHGAGPPRQPGRDHRHGLGLHAAAHQAGTAEAFRRQGAVLAGLQRARHRRRPAFRGARHAAVGARIPASTTRSRSPASRSR